MFEYIFVNLENADSNDEGNYNMAIESLKLILEEADNDLIETNMSEISLKLA